MLIPSLICALASFPHLAAFALSSVASTIPYTLRSRQRDALHGPGSPALSLPVQPGGSLCGQCPPSNGLLADKCWQTPPLWPCAPPCGPGRSCSPELGGWRMFTLPHELAFSTSPSLRYSECHSALSIYAQGSLYHSLYRSCGWFIVTV